MKRIRTIPLFVVLFITTVLILPMAAGAATSDRTLPATSVNLGAQFTVSMTVADYGSPGMVVETLPAGFTYVDSTMDDAQVIVDGNTITFVLISGETSFSYDVYASSTDGTYDFSGTITDSDFAVTTVSGDTLIVVGTESGDSTSASAVRALPTTSVNPGAQFTVSMTVADYGSPGMVVETLPAGFTYVDSTMDDAQVIVDGNTITFVLISGETSFSYDVYASSTDGTYDFSGTIKDSDFAVTTVSGDTSIVVGTESDLSTSAVRTLPATSVDQSAQFTVSMTVADYGSPGMVVETLPAGFTYVDSTMDDAQVIVDGNTITFVLISDETSFDYTVITSAIDGTYAFSGLIKNSDMVEFAVTGDTSIVVAPPGPPASAIRTLPTDPVKSSTEFTVSMTVADYGSVESVVETLPAGFTYVSSTLNASNVAVSGNTVTFTLVDESSFAYTVEASSTDGTYAFSGVIKNPNMVEFAVTGDTLIEVFVPNDLPLEAGWNFISVPNKLADPNVSSVLTGVAYDSLLYYNADSCLWETVSTFKPLKGYWINVTATGQVILEDSLATDNFGTPASLSLFEGWNAIGSTDSMDTYSAEFVLQYIDGSYSKIVGPWNAGVYELIGYNGQSGVLGNSDVGTDIFDMIPYSGYWVYVTEDCNFS